MAGSRSGPARKPILKGEQELTIAVPPQSKRRRPRRAPRPRRSAVRSACAKRAATLAAEAGVPPYVIFHDSTLREIAATRRRNLAELPKCNGVGRTKLERYGDAMMAAVARRRLIFSLVSAPGSRGAK